MWVQAGICGEGRVLKKRDGEVWGLGITSPFWAPGPQRDRGGTVTPSTPEPLHQAKERATAEEATPCQCLRLGGVHGRALQPPWTRPPGLSPICSGTVLGTLAHLIEKPGLCGCVVVCPPHMSMDGSSPKIARLLVVLPRPLSCQAVVPAKTDAPQT